MNFGAKLRALAATLVMSGLSVAVAQPGAPGPAADPAGDEETPPPAEMVKRVQEYLPEMERNQESVRVQAEKARESKDVVKTLCLNDKLGQIDLAIRTAADRATELEAALKQNDLERAQHQYTVARVLRERVTALVFEAQQCIGEETGFIGDSDVTLEIDPNIAATDPSVFPEEPMVSAPPVTSSPTL